MSLSSHHFLAPSRFKRKKITKNYPKEKSLAKKLKLPKINKFKTNKHKKKENKRKKKLTTSKKHKKSKRTKRISFISIEPISLPLLAEKNVKKKSFQVISVNDPPKQILSRNRSKSALQIKSIAKKSSSNKSIFNSNRSQRVRKRSSIVEKVTQKRILTIFEESEKERLVNLVLSGDLDLIECIYECPSWMCLEILNDRRLSTYKRHGDGWTRAKRDSFINACHFETHDTPLHVCVFNGKGHSGARSIALKLIQMGVNINAMNRDGATALDWAILTGQIHLAKKLLKKGARQGPIMFENDSLNYFEKNVPTHFKEILNQFHSQPIF